MTDVETVDGNELVVDALEMSGSQRSTASWGYRSPISPGPAQARGLRYLGSATSRPPARGPPGGIPHRPARRLSHGVRARIPQRARCARERHHRLFPDDPDQRVQRAIDRRSTAGDYEELDQLATARPFAKAAYRVDSPELIGIGVGRAFRAAVSGRPGGWYLDSAGPGAGRDRAPHATSHRWSIPRRANCPRPSRSSGQLRSSNAPSVP